MSATPLAWHCRMLFMKLSVPIEGLNIFCYIQELKYFIEGLILLIEGLKALQL